MSVRQDKSKVLSASELPTAGNQLGEIHLAISVSKHYVCNGRRNGGLKNFAQCNPFPASYIIFRIMGTGYTQQAGCYTREYSEHSSNVYIH